MAQVKEKKAGSQAAGALNGIDKDTYRSWYETMLRIRRFEERALKMYSVNKISEHLGFIPIVFSAPRDIELVTGSSQSRRRYFDHLLCQVDADYLHALMQYNYLLQQRNAALKAGMPDLQRIIQTYDEQMAPFARIIFEKRQWLLRIYTPLLQQHYDFLSDKKEVVDCAYESQLLGSSYEIEADRSWPVDKNTQRSNAGIHKDDVDLKIKTLSAKEFGSQGQIKSLIFAMHLSKYAMLRQQKGYNPILVLDDIFDKLDDKRLHRLMEILHSEDYGQIFISDTSKDRLTSGMLHSNFKEIQL